MIVEIQSDTPCQFALWNRGSRTSAGRLVVAQVDGELVSFKIGYAVGGRFGRRGPWMAVWHDGDCVVQGNFADNYRLSTSYVSRIEKDAPVGTSAKDRSEVPVAYDETGFNVVWLPDEIDAPGVGRCWGVKLRGDDVGSWIEHAVIRRRQQDKPLRTLGVADTGQGRRSDPAENAAVEQRAVTLAMAYFSERYDSVLDVGNLHLGYDLECTRGRRTIVHVEVKGTTGDEPEVTVTPNEQRYALSGKTTMALAVVTGIRLRRRNGLPLATGGRLRVCQPWRPRPEDFTPTEFRYRLGPTGRG